VIGDRWGVTSAETARRYPCDEFVPAPVMQAWRGVTVQAPAEHVWAWLKQIRLAPYSYDWIDNLGRRSPRELHQLPEPAEGERFTSALGGRPLGRVLSCEPGTQLTGTIMGAVMSYVIAPTDRRTTRLLLKVVTARAPLTAPLLCLGDLIMARKQLLNFAHHAERTRPNT
jgi:hypothetical protein